jgi:hypothetical protein
MYYPIHKQSNQLIKEELHLTNINKQELHLTNINKQEIHLTNINKQELHLTNINKQCHLNNQYSFSITHCSSQ